MQGQDHVVEEDVLELGNLVGATFKGDKSNMFSVLSKPGSSKCDSMGAGQGGVSVLERSS
jgi:hypothetical protein